MAAVLTLDSVWSGFGSISFFSQSLLPLSHLCHFCSFVVVFFTITEYHLTHAYQVKGVCLVWNVWISFPAKTPEGANIWEPFPLSFDPSRLVSIQFVGHARRSTPLPIRLCRNCDDVVRQRQWFWWCSSHSCVLQWGEEGRSANLLCEEYVLALEDVTVLEKASLGLVVMIVTSFTP